MSFVTTSHAPGLDRSDRERATKAGLGVIARELHEALKALGATPELQRVIREIPDSRSRLSYVGEMTEKAAHRVLDLVGEAMPRLDAHIVQARHIAASASGPEAADQDAFAQTALAVAEDQKRILTDIMMAQDFQDLSGQVIKKVIDMITRTERQLIRLLVDDEAPEVVAPTPLPAVLEGPQTPDTAMAQESVDDLLASLGF